MKETMKKLLVIILAVMMSVTMMPSGTLKTVCAADEDDYGTSFEITSDCDTLGGQEYNGSLGNVQYGKSATLTLREYKCLDEVKTLLDTSKDLFDGEDYTLQWYYNVENEDGTVDEVAIDGATNPSYTIDRIDQSTPYAYSVDIYVNGGFVAGASVDLRINYPEPVALAEKGHSESATIDPGDTSDDPVFQVDGIFMISGYEEFEEEGEIDKEPIYDTSIDYRDDFKYQWFEVTHDEEYTKWEYTPIEGANGFTLSAKQMNKTEDGDYEFVICMFKKNQTDLSYENYIGNCEYFNLTVGDGEDVEYDDDDPAEFKTAGLVSEQQYNYGYVGDTVTLSARAAHCTWNAEDECYKFADDDISAQYNWQWYTGEWNEESEDYDLTPIKGATSNTYSAKVTNKEQQYFVKIFDKSTGEEIDQDNLFVCKVDKPITLNKSTKISEAKGEPGYFVLPKYKVEKTYQVTVAKNTKLSKSAKPISWWAHIMGSWATHDDGSFKDLNSKRTFTVTVPANTNMEVYLATSNYLKATFYVTVKDLTPCTHTWNKGTVTVEPTCTKAGTATYECTKCGEKKTSTVKALGHKYTKETVGKAATTKKAGYYYPVCEVCGAKGSKKTINYAKTLTISQSSYVYSGEANKPAVTVKDSKKKVISSDYYDVTYENNTNVGTATAIVTFKGKYSGTLKKTFTIVPEGTSIVSLTAESKGFEVRWDEQIEQTAGYEVSYSTSSKFSKAKTVTVSDHWAAGTTVSKLSAKKKYYVRVRTYQTVGKTKYYSAWSAAMNVTTLK